MVKRLLLILLLVSCKVFAAVDAEVDRTEIQQGESFQVTYTIKSIGDDTYPNLAPLRKDFNVLGTGQSTQIIDVNGSRNVQTQVVITLSTDKLGGVTIPALQFGNEQSKPLSINVKAPSATSSDVIKKNVLLTAVVKPNSADVQSQVTYTLRFYHAQRVLSGQLSTPEAKNAIIEPLGQERRYQTTYQGKAYHVLERRYAIFPQTSGTLTIKPPVFTGVVDNGRLRLRAFGPIMQNYSKPIRLVAPELSVTVKPMPNRIDNANWFPLRDLILNQQWDLGQKTPHVGDPVTRTITLRAYGSTQAQLPQLSFKEQKGVNVYPDKVKETSGVQDDSLVSQRVWRVAYIPTQAGEITLPELTVRWWDTQKQHLRTTTLAAKTITILPTAAPSNPTPPLVPKPSAQPLTASTPVVDATQSSPWLLWLLLITTAGWVVTLFAWWRSRMPMMSAEAEGTVAVDTQQAKAYLQSLRQACNQNDAHAANKALLAWANALWPDIAIRNLGDILHRVEPGTFSHALTELQQCLYAANAQQWQGQALWDAFKHVKSIKTHKCGKSTSALPPLYQG